MRTTRPGDADAAGGSASSSDTEWRAGLADLIASLQNDLTAALDAARAQALQAVRSIEERGAELFSALDDERSALESERTAEQAARDERVAALQAEIDGVEAEIQEARAEAERDADATRAAARRRADTIIAEAEARAEAIIAEARERAVSGPVGSAAAAGEGQGDVQGRLRGLSDRVGRLLSHPAAGGVAAGAAAGVAGVAAAAGAPAAGAPAAPTPVAPVTPATPPSPPTPSIEEEEELGPAMEVPDAGLEAEERAAQADQQSAFAATPSPAPVVQLPSSGSSSWFKEELTEEESPAADEAVTRTVPVAPVWSPSNALRVEEEEEEEQAETIAPTSIHAAPSVAREAAQPEPAAVAESAPTGPVTQTLIFQAVPNFQAALALERSLKAMSEVREVRVADFDERQLTFQVTHELGGQLPRVLLTQRGSELELVDSRPERVEFVFRS
jgi:hypothetical protein